MNFTVVNHEISVKNVSIIAIASSAIFLIGDTKTITSSSIFDTPPESLIIGPLVPLTPRG